LLDDRCHGDADGGVCLSGAGKAMPPRASGRVLDALPCAEYDLKKKTKVVESAR
jgi:hypothetical protein